MSADARHLTLISSDQPVAVNLGSADDGTWFRVLNWLIDSGVWGELQRSEMAILGVLLRHRNQDGLVLGISVADLCRLAKVSESQCYAAITALRSHPMRLLAHDKRRSLFEPLPGRSWASRRTGAPPGFRPAGLDSYGQENIPVGRRVVASPSHSPSPLSLESTSLTSTAAAAAPQRAIEKSAAAAAALLRREGIGEAEATELAISAGYETVRRVIANADAMEEAKRLTGSRRGYIANGVREGYGLWKGVERRLTRTINEKCRPHVSHELREDLAERDLDGAMIVRMGIVGVAEIDDLDGAELVRRIACRITTIEPCTAKRRAER